ncbi:MAG TPA: hypothetical protein VFJ82_26490 [Longimicrobium sp.]|nr:hypothetical protein [Longimicrobium sp.]
MEPGSLTLPHLDDGDLLCLLDGEADAASRVDADAHLRACPACRERMERYRTRRDRLAQLLARADFAVPASAPPSSASPRDTDDAKVIPLRPRAARAPARVVNRPWLRAAAVVLLLIAAAAVATPARAWIAAWIGRQVDRVTHESQPAPPRSRVAQTPAPPAAPQPSAQVRFVPAGGELRVDVAHTQASGALTLVRVDGPAASAEVLGPQSVELLVVPSGLRIRNTAAASADYRVQVPDGVRHVRVRIGGGRETVVDRAEIESAGRTIPLAPR